MTSHLPFSAPRQRLRAELRNERKQAGLTQKQVATAMDWSPSKMLRIEAGIVGISATDLRALLTYYKVDDQQRTQELIALVQSARTRTTPTSGGEH